MYRSPFKAGSKETCSFKKKGSWAAGYHTGVDRVSSNTTLVSPADGTVQRSEYNASYGNMVIITTTDGKSILMAHMKDKSKLKVGTSIKMGDAVGTMGNTGNSFGVHLHIEVQNSKTWAYNKNLLNPNNYIDWNNTTSKGDLTVSDKDNYSTPVKWQNGSTKEIVYMQSNLTNKLGSLSAKEAAQCYGKTGDGYIIVYNLDGTKKHKAGFVKYKGGVTKAPTSKKIWTNGSTNEIVYADTAKKTSIGTLSPKESCTCLGKIDGMYLVFYKIHGTNTYKVGFVTYNGGC